MFCVDLGGSGSCPGLPMFRVVSVVVVWGFFGGGVVGKCKRWFLIEGA